MATLAVAAAVTGGPYTLTYRGSSYIVAPSRQEAPIPGPAATYELIYRGSTYVVHGTAKGERFIRNVQPEPPSSPSQRPQLS